MGRRESRRDSSVATAWVGVDGTPNVLTNRTNGKVHATGNGLYMPDTADPTVGAYKFCVASRNELDPAKYDVTVVRQRRAVT